MFFKNYLIFILLIGFLGCSTTEEFFDDITAPDYVNSSRSKSLEIPPDLSELEEDTSYKVPGEAASYKDYMAREKLLAEGQKNPNAKRVVENPEGMKIIKSGNLRWLVVEEKPDLIWPHVKGFWEDLGFRVTIANKRTGIIETEWMDTDDIKLDQNRGALSTFDKWLDSLSGFADKRKFRTRVEYDELGNTEIYISQRSAEAAADQHLRILEDRKAYNASTVYKIEEYKDDNKVGKKIDISEQREKADYEIDSELLTRLMIKLGATDLYAKEKIKNPEVIVKSEIFDTKEDVYIKMNDPYDRSWRRLGLALDLIGFVTEDKNRSEGIYFVRFNEIDIPQDNNKEEEGLIDSLIFWDHDKKTDSEKEDKETKNQDLVNEENVNSDEPTFTGIEAPEVKPIDEDYVSEEYSADVDWKKGEEETWLTSIWPSWGGEDKDNLLPENEKRYRVRIKPGSENFSIVYIDLPSGRKNISIEARKILNLINEYLK
jgi:outer membrane protein assembly factor BamC